MEIELHARHVELSDKVRDYVEKKIGKLDRYLPDIKAARVELSHGTRRSRGEVHGAQITVWVDATVLRAEEIDSDLFAAVDLAADKLHRQIERYRGKRLDRWQEHERLVPDLARDEPEAPEFEVVRRKRFALYPMNEAEAVEQIDLLGHDFFMFMNGDSGQVNVIYRRKDGGYGLIEPVLA